MYYEGTTYIVEHTKMQTDDENLMHVKDLTLAKSITKEVSTLLLEAKQHQFSDLLKSAFEQNISVNSGQIHLFMPYL